MTSLLLQMWLVTRVFFAAGYAAGWGLVRLILGTSVNAKFFIVSYWCPKQGVAVEGGPSTPARIVSHQLLQISCHHMVRAGGGGGATRTGPDATPP